MALKYKISSCYTGCSWSALFNSSKKMSSMSIVKCVSLCVLHVLTSKNMYSQCKFFHKCPCCSVYSEHILEYLITHIELCEPLHFMWISTSLHCSCTAPLFKKKQKKQLPLHPFGLELKSAIIKMFVCVLVGGKLWHSL